MKEYRPDIGIIVLTNDIYQPKPVSEDLTLQEDDELPPIIPIVEELPQWVNDDLALMRLDAAALLYAQQVSEGKKPCIIVSGGNIRGKENPSLAEIGQREIYNQYWIPSSHIFENHALETVENAVYSSEQLDLEGIRKGIAVTNGFHVPRAQYCFDWFGKPPGVTVLSAEDTLLHYFPDLEEKLTAFKSLPEIQERAEREITYSQNKSD